MTPETFARCQALAELALAQRGVTFSVYSDQRGTEKVMPVCLVPRVIAAAEWARLERGLVQRLTALQMFLDDLYGEQKRAARQGDPGRPDPGIEAVHPAAARPEAAGRRAAPHRRHRSDPQPRRRAARAGGQPAHAVGRLVRDREPPGHQARLPDRAWSAWASGASTTTRPSWSRCCARCRPRIPRSRRSSC